MTRFLPAVLAFIGMATLAYPSAASPQGGGTPPGGPPQLAVHLVEAWVWPAWGDDATGAINDPNQAFKSIQSAIDALSAHILAALDPTLEGVVWCMPGVYGPTASQTHGPSASGDTFPIWMKHRVHVRGVSARR